MEFAGNHATSWTRVLASAGVCPRCVLRFLNVRTFAWYQLPTHVLCQKFDEAAAAADAAAAAAAAKPAAAATATAAPAAGAATATATAAPTAAAAAASAAAPASKGVTWSSSPCVACVGILQQTERHLPFVLSEIRKHNYQIVDYCMCVTIPITIPLRHWGLWYHLRQTLG